MTEATHEGSPGPGPGVAEGIGQALAGLHASAVGPEASLTKLPLIVARDLEERFLRDGWPVGRTYGGEAELAAHYGVGRDVMREALRVLEARDEVQVRRGPRGGVVVAKPCDTHLRVMIGGYAYLTRIGPAEIVEAWSAVHVAAVGSIGHRSSRVGAGPVGVGRPDDVVASDAAARLARFAGWLIERSGGLLSYLSEVLAPLLPPLNLTVTAASVDAAQRQILHDLEQGRTEDAVQRTRALFRTIVQPTSAREAQADGWSGATVPEPVDRVRIPAFGVVRRMMSEIEPDEWVQGRLLGHEGELAERYSADRSVVRQAIRIMEDAETAVMQPGRGRGLTTRRPSSAPLSRRLWVHLASNSEPREEADLAVRRLLIEMAGIAAQKVGAGDVELIDALGEALEHLGTTAPVSSVAPIERMQHQLAHNALLSLVVEGAEAYLTWSTGEQLLAPSRLLELYARSTLDVVLAIRGGDAQEAARLQSVKLDVLARCRGAEALRDCSETVDS